MTGDDRKVHYDEASLETGLCVPTLYTYVRRNQIPHYRLSKRLVVFSVRELREWMAARHRSGGPVAALSQSGGAK